MFVSVLSRNLLTAELLQVRDEEPNARQAWLKQGYVTKTGWFVWWDFPFDSYIDSSKTKWVAVFFCFPVVDLLCMELTACQTCAKRNQSPWSAMWSVSVLFLFHPYVRCTSSRLFSVFWETLVVFTERKAEFGMRLLTTDGDEHESDC